jgi:hypothetical protein
VDVFPGTAHYHIILISKYCNLLCSFIFLYILESQHCKHSSTAGVINDLGLYYFPLKPPEDGNPVPKYVGVLMVVAKCILVHKVHLIVHILIVTICTV